jgi:catechol 2,3-dioxygenase-like lactoylglutathione lyase family enzyme
MNRLQIDGISHLAIEVSDLKRAESFYRDLLGFDFFGRDLWPDCGHNSVLHCQSGQTLVLAQSAAPRSLPHTGAHQAYGVSLEQRSTIQKKLANQDVQLLSYKEDRPGEAQDNFYFYDPDGNRIQLVVAAAEPKSDGQIKRIDHAAVEVFDLEWAEDFYVNLLGLPVDHRVGWSTENYARAKLWGEGNEEMAPGTRRWDQLYSSMEKQRRVPRPNMQLYLGLGSAALGLYLAVEHRQEPPEEQSVGTPRIAVRAPRRVLDEAARLLEQQRWLTRGPVEHSSAAPVQASLYFKDPSGNFLELCAAR